MKRGLAALGFVALPGGLFAAPSSFKPKGKPNFVFGILSDTHLMVDGDGKSLYRTMTFDYIRNAFKLFKARKIDAFVHLGDAAHRGCVREWEFHKEVFEDVFGKKDAPPKIIIVGNHELFGDSGHCKKVFKDPAVWSENAICADVKRHYERIWGEPYSEFFHREIKGIHFFGRHWVDHDTEYNGTSEVPFAEYILSNAEGCALKGEKPFFILSHRRHHFRFCNTLRAFPNAVAFMGHWHQSNADWKTIYLDDFKSLFPHIQVSSCRFDGHNGMNPPDLKIKLPEDSSSFKGDFIPSRQAMIVNIYDDMVVFERHEVDSGGKLGPDWVLPLGRTAPHPFSREELRKVDEAPEFPANAQLAVKRISSMCVVEIPFANARQNVRPYAYNVVAAGDDPKARYFKSAYFSGVNSAIGHEPGKGVTRVEIPVADLPAGKKLTIAVRPVSSLGAKGKAIGTTWRA